MEYIKDKHILVVGASSGIGQSIVALLQDAGANISATYHSNNLSSESKYCKWSPLDVRDAGAIQDFVSSIDAIDGFVYLPGVVKLFPVSHLQQKHIDATRSILFDGAVLMISALLKRKKINASASLVFMSSVSSSFPYKGGAIYTSSKAALETYAKTLALELASKKIRSNSIAAGMVATKILQDSIADMPKEVHDKHLQDYPLGFGKPEDIANVALFLLSNKSKWITGTTITIDGGLTAGA